ncbi:MAG: uncharacterized protein JWN98_131 [Abditibacteriota bacterium]|nr:uncharacterized protein [Abditibacteriota bacterium]
MMLPTYRVARSARSCFSPDGTAMANAVIVGVVLCGSVPMAADAQTSSPIRVQPRVAMKAQSFDLADVKLLPGPFQAAMERNRAYILSLEPDRFLHFFRTNAGLEAKAPPYKGWESMGVAGQTLGHYMTACAMLFRASGDLRVKAKLDYIVDELALIQEKNGNGYVAGIPEGKAMFADVAAGKGDGVHRGWVPWYTMHKLYAGLRDAYLLAGNAKAKIVLIKLSDWAIDTTRNLTEAEWNKMLTQEHGGMNEALADVYALTGEAKYLELARRFSHRAVLNPLRQQQDRLQGLHANTQVPKVIGAARLHELTADAGEATASKYFWQRVVHHHSYAIGANSDNEHFGPPDQLAKRLGVAAAETCNTYNMLKLTRHLFAWSPNIEYADYYERALYNHILASQEPQRGMFTYYVSHKPGHFKTYSTPFDSMWCCVGTGLENHVKYGESIYFHDAQSLWVNLFIPSQLTWRDKGLTVTQQTQFPYADSTRLTVAAQRPVEAALKIRCPSWLASDALISINGRRQRVEAKAGTYVTLARRWQNGDRIDIRLPMKLHSEALPDDAKKVAILYGPLVLAGDLGREGVPAEPYHVDQNAFNNIADPQVPVLVTDGKPLTSWIKPVAKQPLVFRTMGVGKPNDVTLRPFHEQYYNRYSLYWDLFSTSEWQKREAAFRAAEALRRELEARRVDELRIGEQQSEVDHKLQGERTSWGQFGDRRWRHATDGGWFAFDMKVLPNVPMELLCTFWGDDAGNRTFDILVDGTLLTTQTLNASKPGQFFDVIYALPTQLTRGKDKVTVRLQARPGHLAGGLFGCWTLKR